MALKCPHSELFWSVFSRIWTEYGETLRISPYSVRMLENTDQINSECGQFSRSVSLKGHTVAMKEFVRNKWNETGKNSEMGKNIIKYQSP